MSMRTVYLKFGDRWECREVGHSARDIFESHHADLVLLYLKDVRGYELFDMRTPVSKCYASGTPELAKALAETLSLRTADAI